MPLISEKAQVARRFMTEQFAPNFPLAFRALQDMALAGSKAYKNNGKRAWFGFGRDLTFESMRGFQEAVFLLAVAFKNDGFLNLPATRGIPEAEQIENVVSMFFSAYPNWPDAEAAWDVIGREVITNALSRIGY